MEKGFLISIDPGKHSTKSVASIYGREHRLNPFRTKIYTIQPGEDVDAQGNSFNMSYNGQDYIIGEQGVDSDYSLDKASLTHKLATYLSIAKLLPDAKFVNLVLGCPVSIYKNKDLRKQYKDFIMENGIIKFDVNRRPFTFALGNALILPEGSGVVYTNPELFKNKRVAVVDLGGLNMNFAIFNNMVPELESMFTRNYGSNELETKIINQLNFKYGLVLNDIEAQDILKNGGLKMSGVLDPASVELVDSIIDAYLSKILQEIRKNNFNVETLNIVFVGGTSLLIRNKIKQRVPHATIIDDAQWTNADGFLKVGMIKYGQTTP